MFDLVVVQDRFLHADDGVLGVISIFHYGADVQVGHVLLGGVNALVLPLKLQILVQCRLSFGGNGSLNLVCSLLLIWVFNIRLRWGRFSVTPPLGADHVSHVGRPRVSIERSRHPFLMQLVVWSNDVQALWR